MSFTMERPSIIDVSHTRENDDIPESWKTMSEDKVLVLIPSPCNMIIASPTQGGKSTFVYQLFKHAMFHRPPEKILYCYNSTWQSMFTKMETEMDNISFHYGLPNEEELETFQASTTEHKTIVLDDLMNESMNADNILKLFTIGMHHNNCSVILLTHNLFPKSKHSRTLTLNTQVFVVMANNRDKQQIQTLGRQLGYKRFLDAYLAATPVPYTYFIIDLHNNTADNLRLRSNIFPDDTSPTTVYKAL
jgi:hypothetical protein